MFSACQRVFSETNEMFSLGAWNKNHDLRVGLYINIIRSLLKAFSLFSHYNLHQFAVTSTLCKALKAGNCGEQARVVYLTLLLNQINESIEFIRLRGVKANGERDSHASVAVARKSSESLSDPSEWKQTIVTDTWGDIVQEGKHSISSLANAAKLNVGNLKIASFLRREKGNTLTQSEIKSIENKLIEFKEFFTWEKADLILSGYVKQPDLADIFACIHKAFDEDIAYYNHIRSKFRLDPGAMQQSLWVTQWIMQRTTSVDLDCAQLMTSGEIQSLNKFMRQI